MRRLFAKLKNLFHSNGADLELDRELSAHLALLEDEFQRRGISMEDARFEAARLWQRGAGAFACELAGLPRHQHEPLNRNTGAAIYPHAIPMKHHLQLVELANG
jgi:hypothetical protein